MRGHAAKRDDNEPEIRRALEFAGWKVFSISMPGWPDLMCVRGNPARIRFVDVKARKGKLTTTQALFFPILAAVGLPVAIVRTTDEARQVGVE